MDLPKNLSQTNQLTIPTPMPHTPHEVVLMGREEGAKSLLELENFRKKEVKKTRG